jgi:hypothetical protein
MVNRSTFINGMIKGFKTVYMLGKIMMPIYIIINILKYTPIIIWISNFFAPLMGLLGLPGEASIILVLGNFLNLYAAIGAMKSLSLTGVEITTIALFLSFSHSLFVESAVSKKVGIKVSVAIALRITMGLMAAFVFYRISGAQSVSTVSQNPGALMPILGDKTYFGVVLEGVMGSIYSILSIAKIVIPLMLILEISKDAKIIDKIADYTGAPIRYLGLSKESSFPMFIGIVFGLSYGAGVIVNSINEGNISKRDTYLLLIFLNLCHAIFEDTLIFVEVGANGWVLAIPRIIVSCIVTMIVSKIILSKHRGTIEA